jgi:hypothetical protein
MIYRIHGLKDTDAIKKELIEIAKEIALDKVREVAEVAK